MTSAKRSTATGGQTAGRIHIRIHSLDAVEAAGLDWERLSKYERWLALQPPDSVDVAALSPPDDLEAERVAELAAVEPPAPTQEIETSNTTTDELNEYIVDNLDETQSTNEDASHLAVGDDGASGTDRGNTSLNNEQGRFQVTDTIDNGRDLRTSTFLDSTEANGVDIDEVALHTAASGGLMLNHSTIQTISKTANNTATIDVELQFRSA